MKKNGFIATSILYSFFLIFITLFVALITNYLHNQVLISALDEASWDILMGINNTKISDLEPGEYIKFANNQTTLFEDNAQWVVANVETIGNTKKYTFLSDIHAAQTVIEYKLAADKINKQHTLSIDVANELLNNRDKPYNKSIKYNTTAGNPTINISFVTSSALAAIRSKNYSNDVGDAIFGTDGAYVVQLNSNISGYTAGKFYYMKQYNFPLGTAQSSLLPSYCGGRYDGSKITYNGNNTFGYMHLSDDASRENNYVDYCLYASPVAYNHVATDHVVTFNESVTNDIIPATFSSQYHIRLMATVTVPVNANNTYIAGGRGTSMDPYLLTDGVKVA